jgi:hypothetical protein
MSHLFGLLRGLDNEEQHARIVIGIPRGGFGSSKFLNKKDG